MAIFGLKPWVNPFGKIVIFRRFEGHPFGKIVIFRRFEGHIFIP